MISRCGTVLYSFRMTDFPNDLSEHEIFQVIYEYEFQWLIMT